MRAMEKQSASGDRVVYLDETGFEWSTQRDYGCAPRGQRVYGRRSANSRPRTGLVGALVGGKLSCPMLFEGTCDTVVFNAWLETSLLPHLSKHTLIVMDNATFHKSAKTKELIEQARCRLLFLPPYSPELNPIEKTWANIKRRRKYHSHLSLDQLLSSYG